MTFLALNGTTVHVRSNALQQKDNEHRLDRERMFDGTMRMTRGGVFRQWDVTTALLTESDANTLLTLVRSGAILTASGDVVGSDVAVMPVPGADNPIHIGGGQFRRQVTFTLHETGGPLPPDTTAVPYAFFKRGVGYLTGTWTSSGGVVDYSACTAAGDGDLVSVWQDQSTNAFHLLGGINPNTLNHYNGWDPTRNGLKVRFGQGSLIGAPGGGGTTDGRTYFGRLNATWWTSLTRGEILASVQASNGAPVSTGLNSLWSLGGPNNTEWPHTDGHILEPAFSSSTRDLGIPTGTDLASLNVYDLSVDLHTVTNNYTAFVNNVVQFQTTDTNSAFPNFSGFNIGQGAASGFFDGWFRDVVIFAAPLTANQRRSWYDYLRGAVDDPPLPL